MSNTLETKFDLSDIMNRLDGLTEVVHKSKMASLKKAGMVLKDAAMQGFIRTGLKNFISLQNHIFLCLVIVHGQEVSEYRPFLCIA